MKQLKLGFSVLFDGKKHTKSLLNKHVNVKLWHLMQAMILARKVSSLAMILMMLLVSLSLVVPNATAVGPNQNDFGTTGGDLPDNMSSTTSIPNLIFTGSVSGTGELYPSNDEYDYLRVSLAANEGLAVELSFDSSDDFDLIIYDSSAQNIIDNSYSYNPETV